MSIVIINPGTGPDDAATLANAEAVAEPSIVSSTKTRKSNDEDSS